MHQTRPAGQGDGSPRAAVADPRQADPGLTPRTVAAAVLLIWGSAAAVVGLVAAKTSVGRVVLTLGAGRGVHTGDLAAAVVCAAIAVVGTVEVLLLRRRGRR